MPSRNHGLASMDGFNYSVDLMQLNKYLLVRLESHASLLRVLRSLDTPTHKQCEASKVSATLRIGTACRLKYFMQPEVALLEV